MSVITDEMDRLKKESIKRVERMNIGVVMPHFELGYAYGMDDARRIQETIKRLAKEAVDACKS